jgi:uracil-DNA glycosylase
MPQVELTLLIGQYAQAWHLGPRARGSLTETVAAWRDYVPGAIPLPHPSWRNNAWIGKNPWFEQEVLPFLRRKVRGLIGGASGKGKGKA